MTEAEIVEGLVESVSAVLAVVSIYFTIVSAYIAALYYFLHRAPFLLKGIAFLFMSGALVFLGLTTVALERLTAGLLSAWHALEGKVAEAPPLDLYFGLEAYLLDDYRVAVWAGWAVAFSIYLGLLYLTFLHRWRSRENGSSLGSDRSDLRSVR